MCCLQGAALAVSVCTTGAAQHTAIHAAATQHASTTAAVHDWAHARVRPRQQPTIAHSDTGISAGTLWHCRCVPDTVLQWLMMTALLSPWLGHLNQAVSCVLLWAVSLVVLQAEADVAADTCAALALHNNIQALGLPMYSQDHTSSRLLF